MEVIKKETKKKALKEIPHDKFKRLATKRTNEILDRLEILGNCSNKKAYEYTDQEVDKIFKAIEKKIRETKAKFRGSRKENFKL